MGRKGRVTEIGRDMWRHRMAYMWWIKISRESNQLENPKGRESISE